MKTTNRQVIIDLLAKRFSNVLSDDALDVLQILMELYSDARELDRVEIEEKPTVEASKPLKPKKSKSGGVRHRQTCRCDSFRRRKAETGERDRAGGQAAYLSADPRRVRRRWRSVPHRSICCRGRRD